MRVLLLTILSLSEMAAAMYGSHIDQSDLSTSIAFPELEKLVSHHIGDFFIRNSNFEGMNNPLLAASGRLEALKAIRSNKHAAVDKNLLKNLIKKYETAIELSRLFHSGNHIATHQALKNKLEKLTVNDTFFIILGWTKHTVFLLFRKDSPSTFSLKIFNSGQGLEYHASIKTHIGTNMAFPFVGSSQIPLKTLTDYLFTKSLLEILQPGTNFNSPELFYKSLLPSLSEAPLILKEAGIHYSGIQNAGTCTYFPNRYITHYLINLENPDNSTKVSTELEFLIGLQFLSSYSQKISNPSLSQIELLKRSLVYFSHESINQYEENKISSELLAEIRFHLDKVKSKIEYLVASSLAENAKLHQTQDPIRYSSHRTYLPKLKDTLPQTESLEDYTQNTAAQTLRRYFAEFREALIRLFNTQEKSAMNEDSSLFQTIQKLIEQFNQHDQSKQWILSEDIEKFALKLPLTIEYWEKYDALESINLISKLNEIYAFIYFKSKSQYGRTTGFYSPTVSLLVTLKFLAIADLISSRLVNYDEKNRIPSLYQKEFADILGGENAYFEISDPTWHYQMREIYKYFEDSKSSQAHTDVFFPFSKLAKLDNDNLIRLYDDPIAAQLLRDNHWSIPFDLKWPHINWLRHHFITLKSGDMSQYKGLDPQIVPLTREYLTPKDSPELLMTVLNLFNSETENRETDFILLNRKVFHALGAIENLPRVYASLYSLSAIANFHFFGSIKELGWLDFEKSVKPAISISSSNYFGNSNKVSGTNTVIEKTVFNRYELSTLMFGRNMILKERIPEFKKHQSQSNGQTLDDFWNDHSNRQRIKPNEYILRAQFFKFNLEQIRNLLSLSSYPALQVKSTLSFFESHPNYYHLPEFQVLFEKLIFQPALFQLELSQSRWDSNAILSRIFKLLNKGLQQGLETGNYRSVAFSYHMLNLVFEHARFIVSLGINTIDPSDISPFELTRQNLLKTIQGLNREQHAERSLLLQTLVRMFAHIQPYTNHDVSIFISACAMLKIEPQRDLKFTDEQSEMLTKDLLLKKHKHIESLIDSISLDNIIKNFGESAARTSEWIKDGNDHWAYFGSNVWNIDTLDATVKRNGNQRVFFPVKISDITSAFGRNLITPKHATWIDSNTYEWDFIKPNSFTARARRHGERWTFFRFFEGKWLQLISRGELSRISPFLDFGDFSYWQEVSSNRSSKLRVLAFDRDNQKVRYHGFIKNHQIISFTRSEDEAGLTAVRNRGIYQALGNLDSPEHWRSWEIPGEHAAIQTLLPRVGFEVVQKNNQFSCGSFTDYQISNSQFIEKLGTPTNYLVCEHKEFPSKKLILMPKLELKHIKNELVYQFKSEFKETKLLRYNLNRNILEPSDEDARYYLALRCLFKGEYENAANWIKSSKLSLMPLTKAETETLNWIVKASIPKTDDSSVLDSDPRSEAVSLLAQAQLFHHEEIHGGNFTSGNKDYAKDIERIIARYVSNTQRLDPRLLGDSNKKKLSSRFNIDFRTSPLQKPEYNPPQKLQGNTNTPPDESPKNQGIFRANAIFQESNWDLLYQIASGNCFNFDRAAELLKELTGLKQPTIKIAETPFLDLFRKPLNRLFNTCLLTQEHEPLREKYLYLIKLNANMHSVIAQKLNKIRQNSNQTEISDEIPQTYVSPKERLIPTPNQEIINGKFDLELLAGQDPLKNPILTAEQINQAFKTSSIRTFDYGIFEQKFSGAIGSYKNHLVDDLKEKILVQARRYPEFTVRYESITWDQLNLIKHDETLEELAGLESDMLSISNKYSPDSLGGHQNRLLHLANVGSQLSIDNLISLIAKQKPVDFYNATAGALGFMEINLLASKTIRYLQLKTYLNQISKVNAAISNLKEGCQSTESDHCQHLISQVIEAGTQKRAYQPSKHLEYLIFEYYFQNLITQKQVEALNHFKLNRTRGALIELAMGQGKTSVLLPLLSALEGAKNSIHVISIPEPLLASISVELAQKLENGFSKSCFILNSSRNRYLHLKDLLLILERLIQTKESGGVLITTNSSLQSLFLSFLERLSNYQRWNSIRNQEIKAFLEIFSLFRQDSTLTLDEADLTFDPLQVHQFSIGQSIPLQSDSKMKVYPIVAHSFYNAIISNPKLNQQFSHNFFHQPNAEVFTEHRYEQWKPVLIEAILHEDFIVVDSEFRKLFKQSIEQVGIKQILKNYLLGKDPAYRTKVLKLEVPEQVKELFTVLYDQIHHVFPLTASKKIGVHYGSIQEPIQQQGELQTAFDTRLNAYKKSKFIAIPYHAGSPKPLSRFASPLEALNYTLQLALAHGGYLDSIKHEILDLQRACRTSQHPRLRKRFERIMPDQNCSSIYKLSNQDIESIRRKLKIPEQMYLSWRYVLPQVRFSQKQLKTNSQIYASIFAKVQGFSGTLWNHELYPEVFSKPVLSTTTEETFFHLWRDYFENVPEFKIINDSKKALQVIYPNKSNPPSFIDEAGLLSHQDNFEVAQEIQKLTGQTVVFYDHENKLSTCRGKTDSSKYVSYFDKKHTTGSDIQLPADMTAALTLDAHITLRNLQQSVWRLRGLGKKQRISSYVLHEHDTGIINKYLSERLNKAKPALFGLAEITLFSLLNEASKLENLKIRAAEQKSSGVLISQFLKRVLEDNMSISEIAALYQASKSLFETDTSNSQISLISGNTLEFKPKLEFLKTLKQQVIGFVQKFRIFNESDISVKIDHLISKQLPILPAQIFSQAENTGLEAEIETEQEQEQEKEIEKEVQKDTLLEDHSQLRGHAPHKVLNWNPENLPIRFLAHELLATIMPFAESDSLPSSELTKNDIYSFATLASNNLYVSLNLMPLHYRNSPVNLDSSDKQPYEFEFFGPYYKPIYDLLIVQKKTTNTFSAILIDENDAEVWNERMLQNRDLPAGYNVALYNLASHSLYRQGTGDKNVSPNIPLSDIPKSLLIQSAFLSGQLNYHQDLRSELENFIRSSQNPVSLYRLFKFKILAYKQDSRAAFESSDIEAAFISVLGQIPNSHFFLNTK